MIKAILFFVLILPQILFCQVQFEAIKVLRTHDFIGFKKFTDRMEKLKTGNNYWMCLRDLTYDNKEGVFYFENNIPYKDDPYRSYSRSFTVKLITNKNKIISYDLCQMDGQDNCQIIDKYKDEQSYDLFKKAFGKIFGIEINEKELFITDMNSLYAETCGFEDIKPEGRLYVDKCVISKNKEGLIKWLKSANSERQIYAIDGLLQLYKKGIKPTNQELQIIKFVSHKKGKILTCFVDILQNIEIEEIIKLKGLYFK